MGKRILLVLFIAFALGAGAVSLSAFAAGPPPIQSSTDDSDTSCSDPTTAALIADIRVNGGV